MPEVFVGRQPIYDRRLEVYGYELLFRSESSLDAASFEDGDQATSQVILNAFLEMGAEQVVGARKAFLNLTRGFIVGEYPLPVPAETVVLEVLEDILPDPEVLEGLRRLSDAGFTIALDDYFHREEQDALLDLAHIVKVDCLDLGREGVQAELAKLRGNGRRLKLLAEKVESFDDFEFYQGLGFDLFQGYFLSKPKLVRGRRVPANRLGVLRLLAQLHDPSVEFDDLEQLIDQDVTLGYNLLRHVNSALYSLPRRVEAVHETLVILGLEKVRSIASLLLLANIDDKPRDLISTSLLRAKMCELLGAARYEDSVNGFFTVGLFSMLDAMLDTPFTVILRQLPLAEEIRQALLEHAGTLGAALECTLAYERGNWGEACLEGVSAGEVKGAFLGAVEWANEVERELLAFD